MNEFDKFVAEDGESLTFVYESQFEPHVKASKTKKAARNHDPLALVANSHARDAQEDKLSTAMMLLSRAITQRYSTPTNNRLRTSSSTRNQAVIQDGRVHIYSKNVGYVGNECSEGSKNRVNSRKDKRSVLQLQWKRPLCKNPEFMMQRDNTLEELNASVIMMARIKPTDDKSDTKPTYDAEFINVVNASQIDMINGLLSKSDLKTQGVIRQAEHDTNDHDQSLHDFESLINNVQVEAENLRKMYIELKREDKYLEDIVTLEEKLKSHDRIVYKMSHSLQTIHMLGKKPNKVYDPHLKTGLGYENPKPLKKAIEAQPKMYDGEKLESNKLKVD
ncbi:hypothetical protein Tco_1087384 [Tanacetum coccineum]